MYIQPGERAPLKNSPRGSTEASALSPQGATTAVKKEEEEEEENPSYL